MMAVPVFYSSDLERSLAFYTGVLEFELRYPEYPDYRELCVRVGVVDLVCEGAVIQLSRHMGYHPTVSSANLEMETAAQVDEAFARYTARGLDQCHRRESPVHLRRWIRRGGRARFMWMIRMGIRFACGLGGRGAVLRRRGLRGGSRDQKRRSRFPGGMTERKARGECRILRLRASHSLRMTAKSGVV